jgi:hypothetical protein
VAGGEGDAGDEPAPNVETRRNQTMPRYLIRDDSIRPEDVFDAPDDATAIEYAMECLLDDGAEPGEEVGVFRLEDEARGVEEFVANVAVPGGAE